MSYINNDYYRTQLYTNSDRYAKTGTDKDTETSADKTAAEKKAAAEEALKKAASGYGGSTVNSLSSLVSETLAGMGLSSGDKVSFNTIMQYRDKLTKEFEAQVKTDLKALGVDEKVKFQVVSTKNGGVNIITDSEDKAKIEKYFADNPDMVKKFNKIQSLTNVEEARKEQKIDVAATRQRIQIESMTTWFASTGQSVSSIMDFSGTSAALMAGLNKRV